MNEEANRRGRVRGLSIVVLMCTFVTSLARADCPRYELYGDIENPLPGTRIVANELNDAGYVAGHLDVTVGPAQFPFVWYGDPEEPAVQIPLAGAAFGRAVDVNGDKIVVGRLEGGRFDHPVGFIYDGKTGAIEIVDAATKGQTDLVAISENGLIAGILNELFFTTPFIWANGQMNALEGYAKFPSVRDVNSSGLVLGNAGTAFLWNSESGLVTQIPSLDEFLFNFATAMNENGDVVGSCQISQVPQISRPFLWSGGAVFDLGTLADYRVASAGDLNDRGEVVGGLTSSPSQPLTGFVWEDGRMFDVNTITADMVDGGVVRSVFAINNSGSILAERLLPGHVRKSILRRIPGIVGDTDCDRFVGFEDLLGVLSAWGPTCVDCPADLDDDGAVGVEDLQVVLAHWGNE